MKVKKETERETEREKGRFFSFWNETGLISRRGMSRFLFHIQYTLL